MAADEAAAPDCAPSFRLEVTSSAETTRLAAVGNFTGWHLSDSVQLTEAAGDDEEGAGSGTTVWRSGPLTAATLPLRFKLVANGHCSSPNTRPLVWDSCSRVVERIPEDGVVRCEFEPTPDSSDGGWVTPEGVGAFQLRIGQPSGSAEPLVELEPAALWGQHAPGDIEVTLWEAVPNDPAVPQGKTFALVGGGGASGAAAADPLHAGGSAAATAAATEGATYLLNSQSVEALAFRVDVTSHRDASLLARCFVTHHTLAALEGSISAALVTPDLRHAGTFRAAFLVVAALPHPSNNLGFLQRARWVPGGDTLDIGHRGSGASKVRGHAVRENTLLSFQKAAVNHSDVIEFDVHVTADGECVVFHDFLVPLRLGTEVVRLPIPTLTAEQLRSPDFTQWMLSPNEDGAHKDALDEEKARRRGTLQRALSSAEDMFRSIFKPPFQLNGLGGGGASQQQQSSGSGSGPGMVSEVAAARWFLTDRIASLREAFRRTPRWLGFNVELKYPTLLEVAAMRAQFYSRNHFVDAVLKVVLEEAAGRRVIFSTFDPDCATLMSLKQPRYPVFFLTCGGTKAFADPRMNSLDAALRFALASRLQGVVAEAGSVLGGGLRETVAEFHRHGLFLYTWGDANNDYATYMAQREAGIDAVILDDIEKMAKATNKTRSLFNKKPLRSPSTAADLERLSSSAAAAAAAAGVGVGVAAAGGSIGIVGSLAAAQQLEHLGSGLNILTISPIGSPESTAGGTPGGFLVSPRFSARFGSPPTNF